MTHELMDRLRAANPVVDEPEAAPVERLLGRLEPPRRSRRPLALALAAMVLLAGIVVVSELRQPAPDVLAQAQEALGTGQGEIVHTVLRTEMRGSDGTVRRGMYVDGRRKIGELSDRIERWTAADPRRERTRTFILPRDGGAELWVESDYAAGVSRGARSWDDELRVFQTRPAGTEEPEGPASITGDPVAGIRSLLARGLLRDEGETVVGERRVRRLAGHQPLRRYEGGAMSPAVDVEYLVDADTFVPVRATFKSLPLAEGGPTSLTDTSTIVFETYERIPLTEETAALLRIPDADDRRVVRP